MCAVLTVFYYFNGVVQIVELPPLFEPLGSADCVYQLVCTRELLMHQKLAQE